MIRQHTWATCEWERWVKMFFYIVCEGKLLVCCFGGTICFEAIVAFLCSKFASTDTLLWLIIRSRMTCAYSLSNARNSQPCPRAQRLRTFVITFPHVTYQAGVDYDKPSWQQLSILLSTDWRDQSVSRETSIPKAIRTYFIETVGSDWVFFCFHGDI